MFKFTTTKFLSILNTSSSNTSNRLSSKYNYFNFLHTSNGLIDLILFLFNHITLRFLKNVNFEVSKEMILRLDR